MYVVVIAVGITESDRPVMVELSAGTLPQAAIGNRAADPEGGSSADIRKQSVQISKQI